MNKEQGVFLVGLLLLAAGIFSSVSGWLPEKTFQPPAARRVGGPQAEEFDPPLFSSEDENCDFKEGRRDPFQPKRETVPLPSAKLEVPPLPVLKRVAPGPFPGLGFSKLRPLEEPVPEGEIDLSATAGTGKGEEEEEEEDDGWGGRW